MHVGDISPGGKVWKDIVAEKDVPPLKAEEDKEEVDMDAVLGEVDSEEPEQDWDDVSRKHRKELLQYLAPLRADYKADELVRIFYSEPKKDEDEVYHRDDHDSEVQTESEQEVGEDMAARLYLQPEEDKDHLYHRDVKQLLYQIEPIAAAPVDAPSQRKHSKPEEDRDHLYHR